LGNSDKTNIEARVQAVRDQFAAYDILIAKAQRAGVGKVGSESLDAYKAELAALQQQKVEQVAIEASEAGINAKLKDRKDTITGINARIADGSISFAEGFKQAEVFTNKVTPQIVEMAKSTLKFVQSLAGATPSPKIEALINKLQTVIANPAALDPSKSGKNAENTALSSIDAGITDVTSDVKTRDSTEKANRDLYAKNVQNYSDTQANIKDAYDRTTEAIRKQTAAIQEQLNVQLKSGAINKDQYETRSAQLKLINAGAAYQSDLQKDLTKEIENSFGQASQSLISGVINQVELLGEGQQKLGDTIKNIGILFVQAVAQILQSIAMWIIKTLVQIELQAILASLSGGGSLLGGSTSSLAAGTVHSGGMIGPGQQYMQRTVPAAMFMNAPRFHTGSIVGLGADEQPAILQHGEEVLSKNDPRNAMNGGGKEVTSSPTNIRNVLVQDPKDISKAMASQHGETVVLSHIKNNAASIKSILR
jgi:hypothetical protein